jgi:NADPH:quinone reductase-like Zn-dependent oxidoreductase
MSSRQVAGMTKSALYCGSGGGESRAPKLTPVIDRTYPLVETPEALRYRERGHPGGKVVITI